jgi:glyceraldehyde-3-phosphate dehydrogenase/erythrose-4-phosphate dehydrogenase
MLKGLVPVVADSATKARRELFVGNTPLGTSERTLLDHLNAAMKTAVLATAPGSPVIACRLNAACSKSVQYKADEFTAQPTGSEV